MQWPGLHTALPAEPLPLGSAQPHPLALLQNFLYRCVGTTLGAASSKDVVKKHLRELLETARYQEEAEHEVPAPPGRPGPQAAEGCPSSSGHSASLSACARMPPAQA